MSNDTKVAQDRPALTGVAADLFEAGTRLAKASAHRLRHAHAHWCGCGDYYICHQEPDRCPIVTDWTCPACEQEQQDAWVTAQEAAERSR